MLIFNGRNMDGWFLVSAFWIFKLLQITKIKFCSLKKTFMATKLSCGSEILKPTSLPESSAAAQLEMLG